VDSAAVARRPWEVAAVKTFTENNLPKAPSDKAQFRVYGLRVRVRDAPELLTKTREVCLAKVHEEVGDGVGQAYIRRSNNIAWICMMFRTLEAARTARLARHDQHVSQPAKCPWQFEWVNSSKPSVGGYLAGERDDLVVLRGVKAPDGEQAILLGRRALTNVLKGRGKVEDVMNTWTEEHSAHAMLDSGRWARAIRCTLPSMARTRPTT
jgi:hypothetical protein